MKRVIICGGRDFDNVPLIYRVLSKLHSEYGFNTVIHGGARNTDSIAGKWAEINGLRVWVFPANWTKHGKAAGPIRNQEMIDKGRPHGLIAFPGGKGTADMKNRAHKADIMVIEVHMLGSNEEERIDRIQRSIQRPLEGL